MIVESNNAIAIDVLGDLLKNLAPVLQPMRSKAKTKTNRILCARFFPRFEEVTGSWWNSDWFITLFARFDWSY